MIEKLPAIQFYIGDWRKDPGIQALDYEARGVWFEILCLMHESEDRGKLLLNGRAMPDDALARNLGIPEADLKQIVSKIEGYGVASRDEATGALVCRRMVRDEEIRRAKARAGSIGGRVSRPPKKKQDGSKTEAGVEANGGSSVSVSPSGKEKKEKKRAQPIPSNWEPNDTHDKIAGAENVDVKREAAKFESHAKANGRTLKDWDQGFCNWLRRAGEYRSDARPNSDPMRRSL